MRRRYSDYMPWAKTQSRARFNLATSGVGAFPLRELQFPLDSLEINGDSTYGYAPLQQAISGLTAAERERIMGGTAVEAYQL